MQSSDLNRNSLPTSPGVYLFKSKGERILYIGKAKNIKKRVQQYFNPKSLRKQDMVAKAHHIQRFLTTTEEESLLLETDLIREHTPIYNNLIKGDQSYIYIKIPHHDFPNILLSRYKKNDKASYIGPKVWQKQLKHTLQILRTVLKYRSCSKQTFAKGVVCSDYFFGLCEGRCAYAKNKQKNNKPANSPLDKGRAGGIGEAQSQLDTATKDVNKTIGFTPIYTTDQAKQRYDELITTIKHFFDGKPELLQSLIKQDIQDAVNKEHFERAAKLRDVYMSLDTITQQQSIALTSLKSGIFVDILSTEHRHVRGVLKLYRGKIIDIITGKEAREEYSIDDIYRMIEQEYTQELDIHETQYTFHQASASDKKFTKAERKQLHHQLSGYMQSYLQSSHDNHSHIINELLSELQHRYHLERFPYTIECTDISHLGGEHTVGAISALQGGVINKHGYRRYKINSTDTGDDYLALEELIMRRFTSKRTPPDVFVLDGGKGQLQIINNILAKNVKRYDLFAQTTFIALGKGKARSRKGKLAGKQEYISYLDKDNEIQVIPLIYDPADRLLIHLRDEAHRFANTYRKKRMSQQYT